MNEQVVGAKVSAPTKRHKRRCDLYDSRDGGQEQDECDRMKDEHEGTDCIEQASSSRG